jgi:hypothetical protein
VVCGSWVEFFGERTGVKKYLTRDHEIKYEHFFDAHIAHPTAFIRKSTLDENNIWYNEDFKTAQDYELWEKLTSYGKFANIPKVLLKYRVHQSQVSSKKKLGQQENRLQVRRNYFSNLGITPTSEELILDWSIHTNNYELSTDFIRQANEWLSKLLRANERLNFIGTEYYENKVLTIWKRLTNGSSRLGIRFWVIYIQSHLTHREGNSLVFNIKFFIKCLIRR